MEVQHLKSPEREETWRFVTDVEQEKQDAVLRTMEDDAANHKVQFRATVPSTAKCKKVKITLATSV